MESATTRRGRTIAYANRGTLRYAANVAPIVVLGGARVSWMWGIRALRWPGKAGLGFLHRGSGEGNPCAPLLAVGVSET